MALLAKTTSFDIAYIAGVSQPTVSRALRGSPLVSEQTRARIQEIARAHHYKVDKNASNLRSQHSNTLALLFFEEPGDVNATINPFFLSMLGSITRACAHRGYDLLISFQQLSGDWHLEYEDSRKADGIILLGHGDYLEYEPLLRRLVDQGTHFVRWGATETGRLGTMIGCDNVQGGHDATAHLLALGRKRIAFFGAADEHYPEYRARYQGYVAAHKAAGIAVDPALQITAMNTREAHAAMQDVFAKGVALDAVFAVSDLIAIGAMSACHGAGRNVPDDIAIVGFDDIQSAAFTNPPLTTVVQDVQNAGKTLVETLIAQIKNLPVENRVIPTRLVVRKSSGAARTKHKVM